MHPDFITPHVAELIRNRQPVTPNDDPHLIAYMTKGGTYIVASNGKQTDSRKPRDHAAILPGDLGKGRVIPLYIATHPDLIAELERLV